MHPAANAMHRALPKIQRALGHDAPRTRVNALHADKPRFKLKTQNPKGKAIVYAILL